MPLTPVHGFSCEAMPQVIVFISLLNERRPGCLPAAFIVLPMGIWLADLKISVFHGYWREDVEEVIIVVLVTTFLGMIIPSIF